MKNFAILLILFLSISLAYCAVQPGALSTKQRNRIYGKINAERKKHCLKALRHSSGLARQALAQAKASATSLKGVPLGKGWMLTAYASSKNKNFDQIRPAPRFKLIERTFWNCQQDRCSQSAGKCMNIRNALYGKATHIGCAAAKSLKNGRYFFFYVCKLNKAAPKSASRTLLSPGKCTGCAPAPAPAPRPAPAPAPRPAPAPAPRPAPAPAPRPAPAPAPGSTPQAEINAWLGEQNRVRGCGGALSWDEGLAKQATSWARHLALNNGCNMQHAGNRNGKGENLYKMSGGSRVENIKAGVNMWCLERKAWNCGSNTCTTGKRIQVPLPGGQSFTWPISSCGHYTQIVWRSTTSSVGCGVVACPNSRYMMGVCRYGDQGNYRGRHPFSVSLANDNGKSQCSCFRN